LKSKTVKIIIGSVVGVLLIGSYIYFGTPLIKNMLGANNKPSSWQTDGRGGPGNGGSRAGQMGKAMQPILDGLVKDGTLTKEKASALIEYLNTAQNPTPNSSPSAKPDDGKRGFQNPVAGAVEKGIITQEESDKITAKFRESRPARPDGNNNSGGNGGSGNRPKQN